MSEMIIVEVIKVDLFSVCVEVLFETIGLGDNRGCYFGVYSSFF